MTKLTVPAMTIQMPPHVTQQQMLDALDVIGCDLRPASDGRNFVAVARGATQGDARRHLIRIAEKSRKRWGYEGGYVILKDGELTGWVLRLNNPQVCKPGAVAINEAGLMWEAVGDTDQGTAHRWEPVDRDSRVVRMPARVRAVEPTPPGAA